MSGNDISCGKKVRKKAKGNGEWIAVESHSEIISESASFL